MTGPAPTHAHPGSATPPSDKAPRRPRRHALLWLGAALVVGVLVVVGLLASGLLRVERTTPPTVGPSDGMPEELVTGQTYPATFTVDFPADWPVEDVGAGRQGTTRALMAVLARGVGEDQPAGSPESTVLYCSTGVLEAAGERATLECEITAPSPGPFDVVLEVGLPEIMLGEDSPRTATATFEHTVVPAP